MSSNDSFSPLKVLYENQELIEPSSLSFDAGFDPLHWILAKFCKRLGNRWPQALSNLTFGGCQLEMDPRVYKTCFDFIMHLIDYHNWISIDDMEPLRAVLHLNGFLVTLQQLDADILAYRKYMQQKTSPLPVDQGRDMADEPKKNEHPSM